MIRQLAESNYYFLCPPRNRSMSRATACPPLAEIVGKASGKIWRIVYFHNYSQSKRRRAFSSHHIMCIFFPSMRKITETSIAAPWKRPIVASLPPRARGGRHRTHRHIPVRSPDPRGAPCLSLGQPSPLLSWQSRPW